ncbi:BsuPI-related putative proteinase inhibitor [Pseudoneobacillus sp. C159]
MKRRWFVWVSAVSLLLPTTTTLASSVSEVSVTDVNHQSSVTSVQESSSLKLSIEKKYEFLKAQGILKGKPDGKAHFEAKLSRAELAVSLYRLFKLKPPVAKIAPFADTTKHWAKDEMMAVKLQGWMEPFDGWNFRPNQKMTIEEVAQVLAKAAQLEVNDGVSVEKLPASDWAQGALSAVVAKEFLPKETDYRKPATRTHLVHGLYGVYQFMNTNGGIWAGGLEPKLAVEPLGDHNYQWTYIVKNQTEKEQIVNISASIYDYILKKDGKKVEQYTDNKKWIMVYREKTLKQGEELTFSGEFIDLEKGKYELEIWLIDSKWPKTKTSIEFEITE